MLLYGIFNIKNIDFRNIDNYLIQDNNKNWFITSVLYSSYNSVLLIPVLISIKDFTKNKDIKYITITVTVITTILLYIIFSFLIKIDVNIKELEMPAVYAISKIWPNIKNIYGIIILVSIFTTAISLGISFLNNVAQNKNSYNIWSIAICLSAILFSKVGFSNLVNLLYPILGILGLVQIVQILLYYKIITKSKKY